MNRDFEKLRNLSYAFLDEEATEEHISALRALLKSDDEYLDEFIRISHEHSCLRCLAAERRLSDHLGEREHSRAAHSRVGRRAFRVRWGMWLSVAACLAIIVGALVYNARQEERFVEVMVARIWKTSPDVKVFRAADGRTVVAVVGMDLFAGDRIETRKGESVIFGYPNEETTVTAGNGTMKTSVRIGDTKRGKRLHLEKGILGASVAPQPADSGMVITTPHATAEVKGTEFSLLVEESLTRIDVAEGVVGFTRLADGGQIDVIAGQFALAGAKARDLAPKAYAAGTEWVDGPVICTDDFDSGIHHWEVVGSYTGAPEGRLEITPVPPDGRGPVSARIVDAPRGGNGTKCLAIRSGKRWVLLRTREDVPADAFVITFDLFMTGGQLGDAFESTGPSTTTLYADHSVLDNLPSQWVRNRKQIFRTTDASGRTTVTFTTWINGRLGSRRRIESDKKAWLLRTRGTVFIDNIVIRKLVRAPQGGKEATK